MSTPYVAIVDDETDLVWTTVRRLQQLRPHLEVVGFVDSKEAQASFGKRVPDLLITDVRMPGVTGLDLLIAVRRAKPGTPIIVVTAFGDDEVQKTIRESAGIRYHEKPCELDALVGSIDALLSAQAGFAGTIEIPQLPDLIQIQHLAKTSCILTVDRGEARGMLWFENGEIVHATRGDVSGSEAVFELLGWPGGRFKVAPFSAPPERSVKSSTMELLMDGLRIIDEMHRNDVVPETNPGRTERDSIGSDFLEDSVSNNVKASLDEALAIDGAIGAALVDWKSGMALGTVGTGLNLEVAAAGNTEVVRSKQKVMGALGLKDQIEDILITLGSQYHLIRMLQTKPGLFIYLALTRDKANLALARHKLADIEQRVQV